MTTQTLPPRVAVLPDVLVVKVTDEDIALGQRRNGRECPIARATRRALTLMGMPPLDGRVLVGGVVDQFSVVEIEGVAYHGDGISDFITAYDCSGNPPPCTVTLRRLEE